MKNLNQIVSSNLVLLRKKAGLKQSDIAEKLNYSDKTISKWETGEIMPSVENLVELCKLYNVSLNDITSPTLETENQPTKHRSRHNKFIITMLAISAIWIFATIAFVYSNLIANTVAWIAFVWPVPVSFVIALIFNSIWGNTKANYIYISFLIWSVIGAFYLQFVEYNLFPLFFIGIPAQIAVLLWSKLKKSDKNNL